MIRSGNVDKEIMKKVVFVSGVHGSGKGTLCHALNNLLGINSYSASSLIKSNSDYIEDSKFIDSADKNQAALILGLSKLTDEKLLLDGHFCLLNKSKEIVKLDYSIFDTMELSLVVYVECEPVELSRRLMTRDGADFSVDMLRSFQNAEYEHARSFCLDRSIPLVKFRSGIDETSNIADEIENL